MGRRSLYSDRVSFVVYSSGVEGNLKDAGPTDLNDRIFVIEFISVGGKKSVLDTLYNDVAEVGGSGCIEKVLRELSNELVCQVVRDWQSTGEALRRFP